jgi:hypothetical protein
MGSGVLQWYVPESRVRDDQARTEGPDTRVRAETVDWVEEDLTSHPEFGTVSNFVSEVRVWWDSYESGFRSVQRVGIRISISIRSLATVKRMLDGR